MIKQRELEVPDEIKNIARQNLKNHIVLETKEAILKRYAEARLF